MRFWANHPELYDAIQALPPSEQAELERAILQPVLDRQSTEEAIAAERLHDTDPGRWPEWASVERMRRDLMRDREEERDR